MRPALTERKVPLATIAVFVILIGAATAELVMGRTPICTCGTVGLWVGARDSSKTSQMLADWYTFSHVIHGFLFYLLLWMMARRWPVRWRFVVALFVESAWEVFENTPFVIDRYRATTAARGYSGDSVINSVSDILLMGLGFFVARRLPVWASILTVIILEAVPLVIIRDNLTLNIWMFVAPNKTVEAWQAQV